MVSKESMVVNLSEEPTQLEQLVVLDPPVSVSLLPQTPAWGIVFLVSTLCIAWFAYRHYEVWKLERYRSHYIKQLNQLSKRDESTSSQVKQTFSLLFDVVDHAFPKVNAHKLNIDDLVLLLNHTSPEIYFDSVDVGGLYLSIYQKPDQVSIDVASLLELHNSIGHWIRTHSRSELEE